MTIFERKLPTEEADAANIVRGILKVQAAFAAAQKRPLGRGTHTKGICARATFEVFDLAHSLGDAELAARLAKGLYAKPGVYPATVRFANAASTIYPDRQPDLRALSFSVELPPGLAANTAYQDYSMQSARAFPINDAHTFAVLMSVLSAATGKEKLKALWAMSFVDFCRFARAAALGAWQEHGKTGAYQKNRYWSTVPFRNGPFDAVQYSAIPRADNPAGELHNGADALQDDLIRHLNEDERMSSFDFALQLLDAGRMSRWGIRRDPSFWIENASVEWKESQAPFHVVGRLTLLPKSVLPAGECEPRHIDVTEHATPDSQPLGSINRARRAAELASKQVRRGEATADSILENLPVVATAPPSRLRTLGRAAVLALVALLGLYYVTGFVYGWLAGRNIPVQERVNQVVYLDQGWGQERESADRELYYYTAQGAGMHGVRYSWFVNLERPFSTTRLADPDHMRALDFIVDPVATHANPHQLPIGFARRYDDKVQDEVVDITCAACHNGQLNYTKDGVTTAIRIDGGPAMNAFTDLSAGSFQVEVVGSVVDTLFNPFKFYRFAGKVLGPDANTLRGKWKLWRNLFGVMAGLVKVSAGSSAFWHYPVQEGYGRTDALARIGNVVFGDHMARRNYAEGNAPVSYPYLWNIWKFDWVQYTASVSQPMARNVGEAMGVGADYQFTDDYGRPLPKGQRYRTSVAFDNLVRLEATLQKLKPPPWPADVLGPIDVNSAQRGEALFKELCVGCHGPHVGSDAYKTAVAPGRTPADPMWVIRYVDVKKVGTDSTAADNFYKNRVDMTSTGLTFDEVKPLLKDQYEEEKKRQAALLAALPKEIDKVPHAAEATLKEFNRELDDAKQNQLTDQAIANLLNAIDFRQVGLGDGLNMLGLVIRNRYFTDRHFSDTARACFEGFGMLDLPQVVEGYKPRPLEGVWATPPFLHNGSVPNLYELLSPVGERSKKFFVGRREFDPVKVGLRTKPLDGTSSGFWLDTREAGNRNTGHEFSSHPGPGVIGRGLTPAERMDLIEYLKVHKDEPDGTPDYQPQDCFALLK
jgi:mono/diheme cytochrome c family protein